MILRDCVSRNGQRFLFKYSLTWHRLDGDSLAKGVVQSINIKGSYAHDLMSVNYFSLWDFFPTLNKYT